MLASHVGLYEWLMAFHVLSAVVWVGGSVLLQVLAVRIVRERDPATMAAFAGQAEWVGRRVFAPASGFLLLIGIAMVIKEPAWTFGQFWVLAAISVLVLSALGGSLYLGPQGGKLKELYETQGAGSSEAAVVLGRILLVSRIELVLLILVVFDMVLKPGV